MKESLRLFNEICKNPLLKNSNIILFLNKKDLLGGFQLLDLIMTELKSHMTLLKIQGLSLVEILFVKKKSFARFAL